MVRRIAGPAEFTDGEVVAHTNRTSDQKQYASPHFILENRAQKTGQSASMDLEGNQRQSHQEQERGEQCIDKIEVYPFSKNLVEVQWRAETTAGGQDAELGQCLILKRKEQTGKHREQERDQERIFRIAMAHFNSYPIQIAHASAMLQSPLDKAGSNHL